MNNHRGRELVDFPNLFHPSLMLNPTCFVCDPNMYYVIMKNISFQLLCPRCDAHVHVYRCSSTWEALIRGAHLNSRPPNQAEQRTRLEINGSTRLSLGTPLLLRIARSIWACAIFILNSVYVFKSLLLSSKSECQPHNLTFKDRSWKILHKGFARTH